MDKKEDERKKMENDAIKKRNQKFFRNAKVTETPNYIMVEQNDE